jgi:phthiocerol/phenolphthiocerol synthesis type-I polyketide synthase E
MTLPEALALVAARGRLMQSLPAGAMLAVELPEADLAARMPAELSLAAVNGPAACVVSGPAPAAAAFAARLAAAGVRHRPLRTSHAFHSAMMEPILAPFAAEVARCRLHPPARPWVSAVTGTWVTPDEAVDPAYWSRQLRATVRFGDALATLLAAPERVLLEVGPGNALSGLALRRREVGSTAAAAATTGTAAGPAAPAAAAVPAIASMRHPREPLDDAEVLLGALGRLWLGGVEVDWQRFAATEERRRRRVSLPTYPFERQRYWLAAAPAVPEAPVGTAASAGVAAAGAAGERRKRADLAEWISVPAWRQLPARLDAERAGGPWLVFLPPRLAGAGGARPLVERLAERLAARGAMTVVEPAAPADGGSAPLRRLAPGRYALDPAARESFDALLQELAAAGRMPRHMIHGWTLEAVGEGELAQLLAFDSLLFLAQACERAHPGAPLALSVLTSGLHQVAGEPEEAALQPEKALLLGPLTVLPQEHPNVRCQSIDLVVPPSGSLDHGGDEQRRQAEQELIDRLVAELAELECALPAADGGGAAAAAAATVAGRRSRVLALRGGELFERDFAPLRLAPTAASAPRVRPGGAYLVTGGWGGLGGVLARELARLAPVKLALLGRHGPAAPEIAALEAAGAEVLALVADVSDRAAMAAAIRQAEERLGPLRGVIHAAGVAGGGILQWKTPAVARRVLAPKLAGTLVLEELLRDRELDFFLVCSSVTSLAGGFGQSDYCAANAFCDAYAQAVSRRDARRGRLTAAIGWDRWEEVGMAARAATATGAPAAPGAVAATGAMAAGTGVADATAAAAPEGFGATGHPLLGTCVAASARRAVFRSWLSAERHWVLAEHRVAGVPTLPGTTYLEMARAALAFLLGGGTGASAFGPPVELRDVVFLTPLATPPGKTREVLTVLAAPDGGGTSGSSGRADGGSGDSASGSASDGSASGRGSGATGGWSFRVMSRPAAASGDTAPAAWLEHARGEIAHLPAAAVAAPAFAAAPSGAGRDIPLAGLERQGDLVATGPRWRSLRRLVATKSEGMATLELAPELAADLAELPLHPALLDLAAGAVRLALDGSFLPLAYQRLRLLAPLPPRCLSHFRRRAGGDADLLSCDVTIYDPQGTPVAEIEGFTMRRLGEAAAVQLRTGQAEAAAAAAADAPPFSSSPGEQPSSASEALPFSSAAASVHGSGEAVSRSAATGALATAAGILPAEGAEIFRRILCIEPAARTPHLVVSTAPLAAVLAAADALDREALAERLAETAAAAPAHARPAVATAYAAPDDQLEQRIAEAWQQVLGIERVGVHDNFFELGGSSLAAIQLVSELRRRLGVELPSVAVFEAPTIQRLATYLRPAPAAASLAARGRQRADKQRAALAGLRQAAASAPRRRVP